MHIPLHPADGDIRRDFDVHAAPVHVVDDDQAVRDSLVMFLEASGLTARAHPSAEAFLAATDLGGPGCVLTDVRMTGMSGIDLLRKMRAGNSPMPIIVITGHADVTMAVQALKEGAADFIEKPFPEEVLLDSVRAALDRGSEAFHRQRQLDLILGRLASLTPREREVMDLVVQGQPNKTVAVKLAISVRTVEIHRARVMEKMGAESLSALVRMALIPEGDLLAFDSGGCA
jgi:two-component system response regulator FixJ